MERIATYPSRMDFNNGHGVRGRLYKRMLKFYLQRYASGGQPPPPSTTQTLRSVIYDIVTVLSRLILTGAVIVGNLIPSSSGYTLGNSSFTWAGAYIDSIVCNSLSVAGTFIATILSTDQLSTKHSGGTSRLGEIGYPYTYLYASNIVPYTSIIPSGANTVALGNSSNPFTDLYANRAVCTAECTFSGATIGYLKSSGTGSYMGTSTTPFSSSFFTNVNAANIDTTTIGVGTAKVTQLNPYTTGNGNFGTSTNVWNQLYVSGINMYTSSGATYGSTARTTNRFVESSVFYGPVLDAGTYMAFSRNGAVNSVGVSYFNSDIRLKENIEAVPVNYAILRALDFISFNYIGQTRHIPYGFSAQQLQSLSSDFVNVMDGGMLSPDHVILTSYTLSLLKDIDSRLTAIEERLRCGAAP